MRAKVTIVVGLLQHPASHDLEEVGFVRRLINFYEGGKVKVKIKKNKKNIEKMKKVWGDL